MRKIIAITFVLFFVCPLFLMGSDNPGATLSYLKGYLSEIQGNNDEAIGYYGEALRLDPDSSDIRTELASLYIRKREFQKAEERR
jgi:tetratricopeptide (TPR) repeat protein